MSDKPKQQLQQGNPIFRTGAGRRLVKKRPSRLEQAIAVTRSAPGWVIAPVKLLTTCFAYLLAVFAAHALGGLVRAVLGLSKK